MASLGTLQVSSPQDYEGGYMIERFDYCGLDNPAWHVPAWEEVGLCNLAGPFATVADAQKALDEYHSEGC